MRDLVRVERSHSDLALASVASLTAMACGSALGVPWELREPPKDSDELLMSGSAELGAGEWGTDVQLAVIALEVAAVGGLSSHAALDSLAARIIAWYRSNPAHVPAGIDSVLQWALDPSLAPAHLRRDIEEMDASSAQRLRVSARCRWETQRLSARVPGNEVLALMVPVAVSTGLDEGECRRLALAVSSMVSADPLSLLVSAAYAELLRGALLGFVESRPWSECFDWQAAVRKTLAGVHALSGKIARDVPGLVLEWDAPGMRDARAVLVSIRESGAADAGFSFGAGAGLDAVSAVDRVLAAVEKTVWEKNRDLNPVWSAVSSAVRAGGDTDTVGCLVGALVGAACGPREVPSYWADQVWGWPGLRQDGLRDLATAAVYAGLAKTYPAHGNLTRPRNISRAGKNPNYPCKPAPQAEVKRR
ncbi:MAG: ADP-ribosylglycohydrolase family protein [Actinomycetaceae bacterium]|nr:ADP-ribosylglycohydrolase family protein [Actinomycetaceae bacterium]